VTISSTLDIASHRGGTTGAAANASQCAAFATAPVNDTNGAGGGAGGSFIGAGGNGGRGEAGSALGGTAAAADAVAPTVLRGGCPGQTGATGTQAAGTRGASGGALYLTASVFSMRQPDPPDRRRGPPDPALSARQPSAGGGRQRR
jgi:hypothetical protein